MSVVDRLLAHNEEYAASRAGTEPLPAPPSQHLAVVACMDARIDVYRVLGLADGEAHVIRNAGGVVTDDTIRSLAISQRLLGTREVVLVHHTRCGMATFDDTEFRDAVEADCGTRPPWHSEAFADTEADVRDSITRITSSPFLPERGAVRGFVLDVATGRLHEVV